MPAGYFWDKEKKYEDKIFVLGKIRGIGYEHMIRMNYNKKVFMSKVIGHRLRHNTNWNIWNKIKNLLIGKDISVDEGKRLT